MKFLRFSQTKLGSFLSLPAHGREGQGQHLFLRRFLRSKKRNSAAAEKRGRAKIPGGRPLSNPLPFCPPERKLSKFSVRIFFEKSSDFVQDRQPICKVSVSRLARGFAPRFRQFGGQVGKRIFKQFPNEPIFFSPEGRTQSDNFLPKSDYKLKYKTI